MKGDSIVTRISEDTALAMRLAAGKVPKVWLGVTATVVPTQDNRLDEGEAKVALVTVNRKRW
jgi:hypothetical protein